MDWFLRERCLHPERFKQYKSRILGVGKQYILGLKVYDSNASALRKDIANLSSNQSIKKWTWPAPSWSCLVYGKCQSNCQPLVEVKFAWKTSWGSSKTIATYRYEGVFRDDHLGSKKKF